MIERQGGVQVQRSSLLLFLLPFLSFPFLFYSFLSFPFPILSFVKPLVALIPPELFISLCVFVCVEMASLSSLLCSVVWVLFGYVLPAYHSFKVIQAKDFKKLTRHLVFWIVIGLASAIEPFVDLLVSW